MSSLNPFGIFGFGAADSTMTGEVMPGVGMTPGVDCMPGMMPGDGFGMPGMMPDAGFGMQSPGMYGGQGVVFQPGFMGGGMSVGRMDYSGYVKYSRQQMLEGLRNYVINCNQGRVMISREEKLEETPQLLRHACADCGISYLQMLTFNIPEAGIQIPFYFCTSCGKLFYYKDFAV